MDPLFPRGDRPRCSVCGERPAYIGGKCGECYRIEAAAELAAVDARRRDWARAKILSYAEAHWPALVVEVVRTDIDAALR